MITQFQTEFMPSFTWRTLHRKLMLHKNRLQKQLRTKVRKTHSLSRAYIRRQYYLTSAQRDMKHAVTRNEDIFIMSVVFTLILSYGFVVSAAQFMFLFLGTAYAMAEMSGLNMVVLSMLAGSVWTVLFVWLAAFISNMLSISMYEGLTRKKYRSIRATLRKSLRTTSQTALSWFLLVATITGPVLLLGLITLIYLKFRNASPTDLAPLLPNIAVAVGAWIVYMLAHYSLVPHVLLFEPVTSHRQAFARSRQLVKRRGKIFLIALYVAAAFILGLAYTVATLLEKYLRFDRAIVSSFLTIGILIFAHGILVTFYHKRRLARTN